jgi:hypothetical protein
MISKIPTEVSEAIKRLDASDQGKQRGRWCGVVLCPFNASNLMYRIPPFIVLIQTYIAGLRHQLKDFQARAEHGGNTHAHYHGHELCTSDHGEQRFMILYYVVVHHKKFNWLWIVGHSHGHAEASTEGACDGHACEGGHEHKHEHGHEVSTQHCFN